MKAHLRRELDVVQQEILVEAANGHHRWVAAKGVCPRLDETKHLFAYNCRLSLETIGRREKWDSGWEMGVRQAVARKNKPISIRHYYVPWAIA